ncbi:MAG: surfeit locus protein [Sclerophora amabilis]|nr:MAG: surfeit locus protein [Sclerophora amabilis]
MGDSLEERLKGHARSFNGLLSLIPAKYYYGDDNNSDQWQRKKQSKEQARLAKLAKLDPDSARSAKDVLDERAKKRKREDDHSDIEGVESERPKEGLKEPARKPKKNKKTERLPANDSEGSKASTIDNPATNVEDTSAQKIARSQKRKEKRERQKEKKVAKQEKQAKRKESRTSKVVDPGENEDIVQESVKEDEEEDSHEEELQKVEVPDVSGVPDTQAQTSPSQSPVLQSPIFDVSAGLSGASSTSSIGPPNPTEKPEEHETRKKSPADSEELRARLKARIEALRAARKADGPDGVPARNRQELMDARRKKELERKAHKKKLRLRAKAEEKVANERALATGSSPSIGSPLVSSNTEPQNNFSFGQITFGDGQQMDPSLSNVLESRKRKGPQDPLGAMKAAESKRARINGFDEEKRKDIEEKDMWLKARKRAHGEKIRDDTSLLKKTLKRKEKAKSKSESQWKEREENVTKGKEARQKKREDNLRKRKEEKGSKGKKPSSKGAKKVKRPGFEGSFKAKTGPGKK